MNGRPRMLRALALVVAVAGSAAFARAQQQPAAESGQAAVAPARGLADVAAAPNGKALDELLLGAPLVYQADTIAVFHATLTGLSPSLRAQGALDRLEALPRARMLQPVR